jgi:hypothetical protein
MECIVELLAVVQIGIRFEDFPGDGDIIFMHVHFLGEAAAQLSHNRLGIRVSGLRQTFNMDKRHVVILIWLFAEPFLHGFVDFWQAVIMIHFSRASLDVRPVFQPLPMTPGDQSRAGRKFGI